MPKEINLLNHHKRMIRTLVVFIEEDVAHGMSLEQAVDQRISGLINGLKDPEDFHIYQVYGLSQENTWREKIESILGQVFAGSRLVGFPDDNGDPGDMICEICPALGRNCPDKRKAVPEDQSLVEYWGSGFGRRIKQFWNGLLDG